MALDPIPLLLLSFSVSIGNFFASIGIGLTSIEKKERIKILIVFGFFEMLMPIIGLMIGTAFSNLFSVLGRYAGAALLVLLGAYDMFESRRKKKLPSGFKSLGYDKLVPLAFALSIDNLVVGFALGSYNIPILLAAVFIALVSVALSAIGIEIGKYFRKYAVFLEDLEGIALGIILIMIGILIALG
jgi:putative Mn2+ efflux pump MntP